MLTERLAQFEPVPQLIIVQIKNVNHRLGEIWEELEGVRSDLRGLLDMYEALEVETRFKQAQK